jgi:hypothetical protein
VSGELIGLGRALALTKLRPNQFFRMLVAKRFPLPTTGFTPGQPLWWADEVRDWQRRHAS